MSSDRWLRVEEIYHAALERPETDRVAFLAAACGEDEALAREVRTLLDFDGRAGAFLGRSALEDEARGLSAEPQLLGENDIDGYQILSLEGVGGMGEVYRARELALGREVAIKVLARAAAGRPGDLRRFEAEPVSRPAPTTRTSSRSTGSERPPTWPTSRWSSCGDARCGRCWRAEPSPCRRRSTSQSSSPTRCRPRMPAGSFTGT